MLASIAAGCAVEEEASRKPPGGPPISSPESGCDTCLTFSEVAHLGEADGAAAFETDRLFAVADSSGRYFVHGEFGTQIRVFGKSGQLLGLVGQRGTGPGEFGTISAVSVGRDGTLHVLDFLLGSHTTFTASLDLAGTTRLEIRPEPGALVLGSGDSILIPSSSPSADGFLLHLIGTDGRVQRSFGRVPSSIVPGLSTGRVLAASGDTAVWVGHRNRYRIELWSLTDPPEEPLLVLERPVPWFPPGLEDSGSIDLPPPSALAGLQETRDGLLIATVSVPDPERATAVEQSPGSEKRVTDVHGYLDTIVEVLDPGAGTVTATARRPESFRQFAGPNLLTLVHPRRRTHTPGRVGRDTALRNRMTVSLRIPVIR